jgi:hypothetical protein
MKEDEKNKWLAMVKDVFEKVRNCREGTEYEMTNGLERMVKKQ